MPETIADLLQRLRKQDYTIALTDEGKINVKSPAGRLPDHIRAVLTARREEIVGHLRTEAFHAASMEFQAAVWRMRDQYEARKPLTRPWAEGRALVDIWYGVMPQKEDYDAQRVDVIRKAAAALDRAVKAYFEAFDAQCRMPHSDAQTGHSAEQPTI